MAAMKRKIQVLFTASSATALAVGVYVMVGRSADAAEAVRPWKVPTSASERKNPLPPGSRSVTAGRVVYQRECASCHGEGGKGDGKDGRELDPPPSDLSNPAVAGQSDGALFWKITTGRRPMPSFRKGLSDEERWQVVHFLRTLSPGGNGPNGGGQARGG